MWGWITVVPKQTSFKFNSVKEYLKLAGLKGKFTYGNLQGRN